jgi:uncharacterized protein
MNHSIRRFAWVLLVLVAGLAVLGVVPRGQSRDYAREHYTKFEYELRMRDGKKLFTAVYVPKDRSTTYPILLTRTPYSVAPYGADNYKAGLGPSDLFMRDGYIFVYQDVRGRMMSEGEFVDMRPYKPTKAGPTDADESTDTYDTIDWLVRHVQPNNGNVGLYGISYPGFYTAIGMIDAHPALKAASPQAPISDWFIGDDFHHNGALYLPHAFGFFSGFGWPRPRPTTQTTARFDYGTLDGFEFYLKLGALSRINERYFHGQVQFWNDLMAHESYDAFWQARNLRPHLKNIRPAVMTVGGWFDAEDLFGALEVYKNTERQSPGATNTLVMGPWAHGGWANGDGSSLGDVRFGAKTSAFYQENMEFPFFSAYLKGKSVSALPEAYVFETGRNQWHELDAWPPKAAVRTSMYLHAGGRLAFDPPTDSATPYDEYVSDPARPVPYSAAVATGMTREHMLDDQRFVSRRPDVLTYQTDVLTDDLTVAGPIWPSLRVSTSGTDSDFVVKLVDVYPDGYQDPADAGASSATYSRMGGYQQLVRGEVFRGKFRNSYEKPEPFQPNAVTAIDYVMPDVFHTFRRGHRVMVQIHSSWFPLVNLNPQKFMNITQATDADFQKATERIYRAGKTASRIDVGVLK